MKRSGLLTALGLLVFGTIFIRLAPKTYAVTGSDWQAGRIIDDSIFTNKDSMSVADIQYFIDQKIGTGGYSSVPGQCDASGSRSAQPFSNSSRAQYASSLGRPSTFTCLNNYYEVPKLNPGPEIPASNYGGAPIPAGAKSAAQLIWDAAQRYNISPKVLLVTIQKESAGPLTTDDWPFQKQYTYAMGAHCPDSGPNQSANCDPNYSGFSIQISESAALLRYYMDNMEQPWWTYKKPGSNSILYNPSTACGSSNVQVQNKATAALYTYTPYQPNGAALANLYGTGDDCSAYGNRNFWRIYSDWFGTTYAVSSDWQYVSQGAYVDSARTKPANLSMASPNTTYYLRLTAKNMGPVSWQRGRVNLGTSNSLDRISSFCDSSWINCARSATLNEASVAPGETGTFEFSIRTPSSYGSYNEYFRPVVESKTWLNDIGMYLPLNVKPPSSSWQYLGQAVYTDNSKTTNANTNKAVGGSTLYNVVTVRNTGNTTWQNSGPNPIRLATNNPPDRNSQFCDSSWISCNRAATTKEASVAPGETGTFEFTSKVPYSLNGTVVNDYYRPVVEGKQWLQDIGLYFSYTMDSPDYSYSYQSQAAYSNSQKTVSFNLSSASPNTTYYLSVRLRNTGGRSWQNSGPNPIRLATNNPPDRNSQFCDSSWISCNRAATTKEASVAPGETGTFEFSIRTPSISGSYQEYLRPVVEGKQWLTDIGLYYQINY